MIRHLHHSYKLFTFNYVYYLPYNKDLKTFSRNLRNNSTAGEILLWKKIRAGYMMNYTFNRQKPIKKYIVDFYCKPLNLVIEVDGGYHEEELQKIKDKSGNRCWKKWAGLYHG